MLIVATVLPLNRQVSPEVEGSDLVQSLRLKIEALTAPLIGAADTKRLSAAPTYQAIYFVLTDTLLEDGHALSEYGIQKESELRVVLRAQSRRCCGWTSAARARARTSPSSWRSRARGSRRCSSPWCRAGSRCRATAS
jgi:hypothetical protein